MDHSTKETALVLDYYSDCPLDFTGVIKTKYEDSYFWIVNGNYHREDGPAKEWADGDREWYLNGEQHRKDGPAGIYDYGDQVWCLNGVKHRDDGPAVIYTDGTKEWWLDNEHFTQEEWFGKLTPEQKEKAVWNMDQW